MQTYETILKAGFGPGFLAGNVIDHLRRDRVSDPATAKWCYERLVRLAHDGDHQAAEFLDVLLAELTPEELAILEPQRAG